MKNIYAEKTGKTFNINGNYFSENDLNYKWLNCPHFSDF